MDWANAGFQIDALNSVPDLLTFYGNRYDWIRSLSSEHQFESFSKLRQKSTAVKNCQPKVSDRASVRFESEIAVTVTVQA